MKKILVFTLLILSAFAASSCGMVTNALMRFVSEGDAAAYSSTLDELSGNDWEANDGSLLCLNEDSSFDWYQKAEDLTNNYYSGSYKVYNGKDAIEYITSELSEYALTREEQEALISRNSEYTYDNYYCLVLDNEECMVDGENILDASQPSRTPYYGFYYEGDEYLDLANMNSGNYSGFTRVNP